MTPAASRMRGSRYARRTLSLSPREVQLWNRLRTGGGASASLRILLSCERFPIGRETGFIRVAVKQATTAFDRKDEYMNPDRIRIIKLHKRSADGYTLLWQMFVFLLFGGIYIGLEQLGIGAAERAAAFILLAVMVLVTAIWQSTALGIARVHMLLNGIDLERPRRNGNAPPAERRN